MLRDMLRDMLSRLRAAILIIVATGVRVGVFYDLHTLGIKWEYQYHYAHFSVD